MVVLHFYFQLNVLAALSLSLFLCLSLRFICLALELSFTVVKLMHCFLLMRSRIGISSRRVTIVIGFL